MSLNAFTRAVLDYSHFNCRLVNTVCSYYYYSNPTKKKKKPLRFKAVKIVTTIGPFLVCVYSRVEG